MQRIVAGILLGFACLAPEIAFGDAPVNYAILPLSISAENEVQWSPPEFQADTAAPFHLKLVGRGRPGAALLLANQKPTVLGPDGYFEVLVELPSKDHFFRTHFIAPQGDVASYLIKVGRYAEVRELPDQEKGLQEKYALPSEDLIPLYFDLEKNGVKPMPLKIQYSVEDRGLMLGTTELNRDELGFNVRRVGQNSYVLEFQWPRIYAAGRVVEVRNSKGVIMWRTTVTPDRMLVAPSKELLKKMGEDEGEIEPREEQSREPQSVPEDAPASQIDSLFFQSKRLTRQQLSFLKVSDSFYFCMRNRVQGLKVAFCSQNYLVREGTWFLRLIPMNEKVEPYVLVNEQKAPLKGSVVIVKPDQKINFKSRLANGSSYEFETMQNSTAFRDIVLNDDGRTVTIAGRNPPPAQGKIEPHPEGWKATFEISDPHLFMGSQSGIPLRQDFEISQRLPQEKHRLHLNPHSQRSSYASAIGLLGYSKNDYRLSSAENFAETTQPGQFEWDFATGEKGKKDKSHIQIADGTDKFSAYYETYRGYPIEVSGRLTGIITTRGNLWLLGEVAGSWWYESLFGWKNRFLGDRRWGISGRYNSSLYTTENRRFAMYGGDLKYRFTPGLWNIDESVGLVAAYQDVDYLNTRGSMLGGGLFWARTMPKIFDDLFNIIPWFRYPKWVDMQGVVFFLPAQATTQVSPTFSLEFHGKMFFNPRFFMESSFGFRRYAYGNKAQNRQVEATMAFGTGGFGLHF